MRATDVLPGLEAPRKPRGGYRLIKVEKLALAWWCLKERAIRLVDLRLWFACHELSSRRCGLKTGQSPRFALGELKALTGLSQKRLRPGLARLQAAGLLVWDEVGIDFPELPENSGAPELASFRAMLEAIPNNRRNVPVPRRILRLLAGGARPVLIATILGHLLRCLYFRAGRCEGRGRCKASWIASVFGVDLRRVKEARKELVSLGWLVPHEAAQWELNRWGATMTINLDWARLDGVRATPGVGGPAPAVPAGPELPPPPAVSGPELPPPVPDREPLAGAKNQKPASAGRPTGVLTSNGERKEKAPNLRDVVTEDLRDTGRTLELYRQAVEEGLVTSSESDRLRVLAAAEHARVVGTKNPSGLFVRLLRSKLWHFMTQDDEDAASARLKRHLFGDRGGARGQGPSPSPALRPVATGGAGLSADARLVREVIAAARQAGFKGDPYHLLRRESAEWTRERYDLATRDLEASGCGSQNQRIGGAFSSVGMIMPKVL